MSASTVQSIPHSKTQRGGNPPPPAAPTKRKRPRTPPAMALEEERQCWDCGLFLRGPRAGEYHPFIAGLAMTFCADCLRERRNAALLADPSPIASLLPDEPASPQEAETMSDRIARAVFRRSPARGNRFGVHLALAYIADETGSIADKPRWQLAAECHVDTSTLIRAINWLVAHNCLIRWHQQGKINRYLFPADYVARDDEPAEPAEGK